MDKNGLVTVVSDKGSAAGRQALQEMITPTASPTEWSFAQIVSGIMSFLTSAALILITNARKVIFTDDSTVASGIIAATDATSDCVVYTPKAGQTGKSLEWESDIGAEGALNQAGMEALQLLGVPLIQPVPQKKTAEKLAEELLSLVDANNEPVFKTIFVDQANKRVIAHPTDYGTTVAATLATSGKTAVCDVDGDPEPGDPTVPKLPFEGGEV